MINSLCVCLQVHVSRCLGDLTVKMKLHSLKIMDELQGSASLHSQYLACSVTTDNYSLTCPNISEPHGKDLSMVTSEDDDIFKDALPDFMTLPDSAEAVRDMDQSKGIILPADVFYETLGFDDSDFVSLTFLIRNPESPDYDGIDTQVIFF